MLKDSLQLKFNNILGQIEMIDTILSGQLTETPEKKDEKTSS